MFFVEKSVNQEKIDRINMLARKSKAEGLTKKEREEQAILRQEFLADVRKNMKAQLDQIDVVNPDGSIENLGEKYAKKLNNKKRN